MATGVYDPNDPFDIPRGHFSIISDEPPNEILGPYTYDELITDGIHRYVQEASAPYKHYMNGPYVRARLGHIKREVSKARQHGLYIGFLVGIIGAIAVAIISK